MKIDTKLAEMLCTRLCHDITGPVGAIANGAEFLAEEDSGMQDQAIALITQSASEAVNRLQFYRSAYGRVGGRGEACLSDCKTLVQSFFASGKISLDWPDQHTDAANIPISRAMSRVLYNQVILAAGTLIRGGVLSVRLQQPREDERRVVVSASGITVKWDEKIQKALSHEVAVEALDPSTVQAYYTGLLAQEAGAELSVGVGTESFEICAVQCEKIILNQGGEVHYG